MTSKINNLIVGESRPQSKSCPQNTYAMSYVKPGFLRCDWKWCNTSRWVVNKWPQIRQGNLGLLIAFFGFRLPIFSFVLSIFPLTWFVTLNIRCVTSFSIKYRSFSCLCFICLSRVYPKWSTSKIFLKILQKYNFAYRSLLYSLFFSCVKKGVKYLKNFRVITSLKKLLGEWF